MKFCVECKNKLYHQLSEKDSNKLSYYCRFCGYKDDSLTEEGVCIMNAQLKQNEQKFNHIINNYTIYDPTLPRLHNLRCPNGQCNSNEDQHDNPEVLYIRYDNDNMKYIYLCTVCSTRWKTDDNKS